MNFDTSSVDRVQEANHVIGRPSNHDVSGEVYQIYSDSCSVRCQQLVLHAYGIDVSQEELIDEAQRHGWYKPGHGSRPIDVGNLLNEHGIPVAKYENANVFNLTAELAQGHKVIIGVNSNDLWHTNPVMQSLAEILGYPAADHAVIVSGIDTRDPDHIEVIITDPGTGNVAKAYPIEEFLDAWKDSGFYMVATQSPAPLELNPEMAHFDYSLGHLSEIGLLSYDDFEHTFDICADLNPNSSILHDQAELFSRVLHEEPRDIDIHLEPNPGAGPHDSPEHDSFAVWSGADGPPHSGPFDDGHGGHGDHDSSHGVGGHHDAEHDGAVTGDWDDYHGGPH